MARVATTPSFRRHRGRGGQRHRYSDENVDAVGGTARFDGDQRRPHRRDRDPEPADPIEPLAQHRSREKRTDHRIRGGRRERVGWSRQDDGRHVPAHEQGAPEQAARTDSKSAPRTQNTHDVGERARNTRARQQEERGRRVEEGRYRHRRCQE